MVLGTRRGKYLYHRMLDANPRHVERVVDEVGRDAWGALVTLALAVGAAVVLARWQVNSAWLVLGGGLVGLARALV